MTNAAQISSEDQLCHGPEGGAWDQPLVGVAEGFRASVAREDLLGPKGRELVATSVRAWKERHNISLGPQGRHLFAQN